MMAPEPAVSFIIPVKNAAASLDRCIRSVFAASLGAETEVIVIDNGSSDGSVATAMQHGALVISEPHLKVGALRNVGARFARGAVIAFVDADHEITPDWLCACRAGLAGDDIGAAGKLYDAPRPGTWVQRAYECLRDRPAAVTDVAWLGAGNLAVRREVFDRVGGFDETLEACEDVDLCRAIRSAGWRIISVPGMSSIHHGDPETLAGVFRGELWRGRDNMRVSLRGTVSVGSLPGLAFPALTLILIAVAAVGLVVLTRVGPHALAIAAVGLLGIVGLRAAVMVRRGSVRTLRGWLACAAVGAAYELARAFALILRADHRTRTGRVTQSA